MCGGGRGRLVVNWNTLSGRSRANGPMTVANGVASLAETSIYFVSIVRLAYSLDFPEPTPRSAIRLRTGGLVLR